MAKDLDKLEQQQAARSFTSWKLDLLDAMSIDPRLKHTEFRAAFVMLQYQNGKTGLICPSQETVAAMMNVSVDTARRSIAALNETGWLFKTRPNRHKTNRYRFDDRNVNAMLDRRLSLEEKLREQRATERAQMRGQNARDRAKTRGPDHAPMHAEHLQSNTSRSVGKEEGPSQFFAECRIQINAT